MYRKLYHLGGLLFPLLIILFSREVSLYVCAVLFLLVFTFDMFRLNWREFNLWIFKNIRFVFKKKEVRNFSGSPFFLGGVFLTLLLFSPEYAIGGIICLSVGDSSAAIIGKNFGKIHIFSKTLEGSLAFVVFAFTALYLVNMTAYLNLNLTSIIVASIACSVVELLPVKLDDNLSIPIIGAFVLKFLS